MKKGTKYSGIRIDNGETVTGDLFYWNKYRPVAILVPENCENISDGYKVNPFKLIATNSQLQTA